MSPSTVLVLAKEPRAGLSKTRLSPPFTSKEAAALAEAMLADTLAAVLQSTAGRRVLVLEGDTGPWLPGGFEVARQVPGPHAARIAAAFDIARGPAVLIGMDTPQVTGSLVDGALRALSDPNVDAVLGPAFDGGWWLAGLKDPNRGIFEGVPMSRPDTADQQRARMDAFGLRRVEAAILTDVDDRSSAALVAEQNPATRFARLFFELAGHPAVSS